MNSFNRYVKPALVAVGLYVVGSFLVDQGPALGFPPELWFAVASLLSVAGLLAVVRVVRYRAERPEKEAKELHSRLEVRAGGYPRSLTILGTIVFGIALMGLGLVIGITSLWLGIRLAEIFPAVLGIALGLVMILMGYKAYEISTRERDAD